jgi:hypothetical protein
MVAAIRSSLPDCACGHYWVNLRLKLNLYQTISICNPVVVWGNYWICGEHNSDTANPC